MTASKGDSSSPSTVERLFSRRAWGLHLVLTVVTIGLWLLVPLGVWMWRRGWRKASAVPVVLFALLAVAVVAAIIQGPAKKGRASSEASVSTQTETTNTTPSPATTTTNQKPHIDDDRNAKATIERALKVIASDYQDFGDYGLITAVTLGNLDHKLRAAKTLKANGFGKRFTVSFTSASGTTFTVSGVRLSLRRTCSPAGSDCTDGQWAGSTTLALPAVPVITQAKKAEIRAILTASVDHYVAMLVQGERVLGSTQYPTSMAGVAAFSDPNSAASRFGDYRQHPNPEQDLSFLQAFGRADHYFTAANEPTAISTWRDDMLAATSAFSQWVNIAVGWQIHEYTTGQLQAAAAKVTRAFDRARRDIDAVVATSPTKRP